MYSGYYTLSRYTTCKHCLPLCRLYFAFSLVFFDRQKFVVLMKFNVSIVSFVDCAILGHI